VREEGTGRRGSETGAETDIAMTISVAEEATASSAGNNWACSNGGSGKDKCGGSKGTGGRTECRGSSKKGFFCNRSRSGTKLLRLRGFWAYGP